MVRATKRCVSAVVVAPILEKVKELKAQLNLSYTDLGLKIGLAGWTVHQQLANGAPVGEKAYSAYLQWVGKHEKPNPPIEAIERVQKMFEPAKQTVRDVRNKVIELINTSGVNPLHVLKEVDTFYVSQRILESEAFKEQVERRASERIKERFNL